MAITKRAFAKILLTAILAVGVAGCETTGQKQGAGAILGAAGGGLLGSTIGGGSGKLAATAAGALLGGLIGSETGKSLDRADALHARRYQGNAVQVPVAPPASYPYRAPPAYGSAVPPASPPRVVVRQPSAVKPFEGERRATSSCKPLVGEPGSRLAYACQGRDGDWFIAN